MLTEAGISVCAPVHDAVLIEAPSSEIEDVVRQTQAIMAEASRIVLAGFELASDAEIIRWPARYMDETRGRVMWDRVLTLASSEDEQRTDWPTDNDKLAHQNGQFVPPVQSY
jgi:hypothetical protein